MEQFKQLKRSRVTKESTISDIASSVRDISISLGSVNERQRALLKVNKAIVLYIQKVAKRQQIQAVDDIQSDLEKTRLEED